MMVWGLLLIAMAVMKAWPETPSAQWLHQTLVERPLALIDRMERRHLVFLVIGLFVFQSFAMAGIAVDLGWVMAIDVSAFVDVMITVWTVAALTRSRGAWTAIRARLPRLIGRQTRPRARRRRARAAIQRKAANDDDGHGAFAVAA